MTVGGEVTSATYYEDVHVPVSMVVGEIDAGWQLITSQLNHERVALAAMGGRSLELFEAVRHWCTQQTNADGTRLIDIPWVRQTLARVCARLEALKLLNWRMAWKTEVGSAHPRRRVAAARSTAPRPTSSATGCCSRSSAGPASSTRPRPAPSSPACWSGPTARAPVRTFGGGSNEVQREILAQTALGLPRGKR